MHLSLWLDEAWVANSVLTPKLIDTLNYADWVQSSPPLYLVLLRMIAAVSGPGEMSLRMVPLAASLAGMLTIAMVLRSRFSAVPAILATALIAANYTQVKYGEQVKQYATDMLTAALLTWLIARALSRQGQSVWVLVAASSVAPFLSFPSVFFLPSVVAVATLGQRNRNWAALLRACGRFALLPAAMLAVNYLAFIRPNRTPALLRNWDSMFLDVKEPWHSIVALINTFSDLLIPARLPAAGVAGGIGVAALFAGAVLALLRFRRGDPLALFVALAGVIPLLAGIAAGFLRLYPMLRYQRMIAWTLPACALMAAFAIEQRDVLAFFPRFVARRADSLGQSSPESTDCVHEQPPEEHALSSAQTAG